jgi:Hedgehog amino-terminal signalling domain
MEGLSGTLRARRPQLRGAVLGLAMAACLAACADPTLPPPPLPTLAPPTLAGESQVSVVGPDATPTSAATQASLPQEVPPGEHMSASGSVTETETQAAGPMLCQIQRDSCAFQQLVIDRDPNILFSEAEPPPYGMEDRMMHPAMQLPLARLAALVRGEWQGTVQLMVTASYDSQSRHDLAEPNPVQRYSLHYEGRSIDLITLPPDHSRNGRLCALALRAGFDWVHNEIDHCHASIQANSLCTICSALAP